MTNTKDFFISYARADEAWAIWIAEQLEAVGYTTVIQAWDFRPGDNFVLAIDQAGRQSKHMIAVLSPAYCASRFARSEWAAAFARGKNIIPVRIRECDAGLLEPIIYIDLVGIEEAAAIDALLNGVQMDRPKPTVSSTFPAVSSEEPETVSKQFPAALPCYWNVPHLRNVNFAGREDELKTLRQTLSSGGSASVTQTITGLGGVGKTELALEYVYRSAGCYSGVWWLRAETQSTLLADYAAMATVLELAGSKDKKQKELVKDVQAWLNRHAGWLLIFDNARAPAQIQMLLPTSQNHHLIVTSRMPHWGTISVQLKLSVMTEFEASTFLAARTGLTNSEESSLLAAALGRLPLALEQAAAYIKECGMTYSKYLSLLDVEAPRLLRRGKPINYQYTIASTWNVSLRYVLRQNPGAMNLLRSVAFLHPDAIPLSLLQKVSKYFASEQFMYPHNEVEFYDAVRLLGKLSLVAIFYDQLSIHRLIQLVIREQMNLQERQQLVKAVLGTITGEFQFNELDVDTWRTSNELVPHCVEIVRRALECEIHPNDLANLALTAGKCLRNYEDLETAESILTSVIHVLGSSGDGDTKILTLCLNELAAVYMTWGRGEEALPFLQQALGLDKANFGPQSMHAAVRMTNIGVVYYITYDHAKKQIKELLVKAIKMYQAALPIFEKHATDREGRLRLGTLVNNIGCVYNRLLEFDKALEYLSKALEISRGLNESDDYGSALTTMSIGTSYHGRGEYEKGAEYHSKALAILQGLVGNEHSQIGQAYFGLAQDFFKLGRLADARKCYLRAVEIFQNCYDANDRFLLRAKAGVDATQDCD